MKNILNKNLIRILILAESFFLWTPTIHAEEIKLSAPKVEKNQAMKLTPEQFMTLVNKYGHMKSMPKVTNPKAGEKHAAIIATLQAQKQAADAQRATFRAAIKVAPTSPALTPPSAQPMAPPSTALLQSRSGLGGNLQMSKNVPSIGSSRLESEKVKPALNIPSAAAIQGKVSNAQMACTPDRQGIWDINGKAAGKVIFTQNPNYNTFTINGCGFGDTQGTAHLSGTFVSGIAKMKVEYWDDMHIVASVDPTITGELDEGNVGLVLVPVGKPQITDWGHKFYAMRETILVSPMPDNVKALGNWGTTIRFADNHLFPGSSIEVDRYFHDTGLDNGDPLSNMSRNYTPEDVYVIGDHLNSVFTIDSFSLDYWTVDPSSCNRLRGSPPRTRFVPERGVIGINNLGYFCEQDNAFDHGFMLANYGLSVWLVGPKGVSPWK